VVAVASLPATSSPLLARNLFCISEEGFFSRFPHRVAACLVFNLGYFCLPRQQTPPFQFLNNWTPSFFCQRAIRKAFLTLFAFHFVLISRPRMCLVLCFPALLDCYLPSYLLIFYKPAPPPLLIVLSREIGSIGTIMFSWPPLAPLFHSYCVHIDRLNVSLLLDLFSFVGYIPHVIVWGTPSSQLLCPFLFPLTSLLLPSLFLPCFLLLLFSGGPLFTALSPSRSGFSASSFGLLALVAYFTVSGPSCVPSPTLGFPLGNRGFSLSVPPTSSLWAARVGQSPPHGLAFTFCPIKPVLSFSNSSSFSLCPIRSM